VAVASGTGRRSAAAVAGLLAAAVAVGVGQLVAGITGPAGSPVVEVGQLQIDLTPPWLKNFAIREFGENDKHVLVAGILVVLAAGAAVFGVLALRRLWYGLTGLAAFLAIGLVAAVSRPAFTGVDVLPTLAAAAAGAAALVLQVRNLAAAPPAVRQHAAVAQPTDRLTRRRFLVLGGTAAGVAAAGGLAGRVLGERLDVATARSALRLPAATDPLPPLPPGVDLHIPGLAPFVTPNGRFYRVDTALILPQVDPRHWRLRIHGMVDREVTLSFDDLLRLPLLEDDLTLCCVSNPVGGPLIGNARWLGASLAKLLRRAGVHAGADQLLATSTDGFTSGSPIQTVMDGRDALLAVGMNGSPLPVAHGFPVRMLVPGLYGYVSATKWLTDLKVTTYSAEVAYWAQRGWADRAPIKTESRIDVPTGAQPLRAGPVTVAGEAWAQHKGIDAVQVRVDGGAWHQATLAAVPGIDTWRQWAWHWDATPGKHLIEARATDATGYTQTSLQAPPEPDGATGYPYVQVSVQA
jgi:DMSO/TMAO reductase YedYZ molybdopterin-dependent catalytic subunit